MEKEGRLKAIEFLSSDRGMYIMGQALFVAIQAMEKVPKNKKEPSNIADMKFLMDYLFPIYKYILEAQKKFKEHEKKVKEGKKP